MRQVPDAIAANLEEAGFAVIRCGAVEATATPWPEVAEQVARLVAGGRRGRGRLLLDRDRGQHRRQQGARHPGGALQGRRDGPRRPPVEWRQRARHGSDGATPEAAQAIVDAFLGSAGVDPEEAANVERVAAMERRYCRARR